MASLSDAGVSERLRLVVARGPHFGPGVLKSASTRQAGLAQAQDVTATVLASVGLPVPDAVGGAPLTSDPAPDNSERRAEARLTALVDYDEASHEVHGLVEPFFTVFAYGQLVIYLLVLLVCKGRMGSERSRVPCSSRVRVLSVAAASVPVSTFLANLLPWWRFPVADAGGRRRGGACSSRSSRRWPCAGRGAGGRWGRWRSCRRRRWSCSPSTS